MGATSEHDDVESSVDRSEQQQSLLTMGLPIICGRVVHATTRDKGVRSVRSAWADAAITLPNGQHRSTACCVKSRQVGPSPHPRSAAWPTQGFAASAAQHPAVGDSGLRPYLTRNPAAIARVIAMGLVPSETRVRSSRSSETEGSPASIFAMRD